MIGGFLTDHQGRITDGEPCGRVIVGGGINNLSAEWYRRGPTERRYIAAPSGTVCPRHIDLNQFTAWGHINPITTKLVFMVFIEAGAFAGQQHLGHHSVSHADLDTLGMTTFQRASQYYIRKLRGCRGSSWSWDHMHRWDRSSAADAQLLRHPQSSPMMCISGAKVKGRVGKSQNPAGCACSLGREPPFLHAGISQVGFCGWSRNLLLPKIQSEIDIEWMVSIKTKRIWLIVLLLYHMNVSSQSTEVLPYHFKGHWCAITISGAALFWLAENCAGNSVGETMFQQQIQRQRSFIAWQCSCTFPLAKKTASGILFSCYF